jgi:hypothetical protein
MKQSPMLTFESTAFPVSAGEDEQTNPGVFGRSLAQWLAQQLIEHEHTAGAPIPEDFGWCVPIESSPHRLYAACSNASGSKTQWQVYVFAEGGLMARLLGRDKSAESVDEAFSVVRQALLDFTGANDVRIEAV